MSSFSTLASSQEDSRPLEIYYFNLGGTPYRYTSAEDEVEVDGEVYTPIAIQRSQVTQGSGAEARTMAVTMPVNMNYCP